MPAAFFKQKNGSLGLHSVTKGETELESRLPESKAMEIHLAGYFQHRVEEGKGPLKVSLKTVTVIRPVTAIPVLNLIPLLISITPAY